MAIIQQDLIMLTKLSPALEHVFSEGIICNKMFTDYARQHDDTHIFD